MTLIRLSRNTLTLLISNIGGAILLFALSALIGRALGSEGLGMYAIALAWVYPLSLLVEFGLTTLMTREVGTNPDLLSGYIDSITRARLIFGGMIMIALYVSAPLISRDPALVIGLQVSAPMVIIQPFYSQFTTAFKLRGLMWTIPTLNLGMIGAQVVLTASSLANGGNAVHALSLNTLTSAGQLVAAWWLYRRLIPVAQTRLAHFLERGGWEVRLTALLRSAFPFALAAVFAALQARIVFFLLESSVIEAGYFSAANRFIEAAKLLPNAFFAALFPMIGSPSIRSTFQPAALGLAALGLIAGLIFTLSAPILLTFVFGDAFLPAVPTLILLGWSLIFFALRGGKTIYWYAYGGEHFVNGVNALAVVVMLMLGLVLVPSYGALGAAGAVLLTEIGVTALLYGKNSPLLWGLLSKK